MFKSREDLYSNKTFENADDAAAFVTVIASNLKSQGYTISEMNVRQAHAMPHDTGMKPPGEVELVYVGSIGAYKETAPKEDTPVEAEKSTVN